MKLDLRMFDDPTYTVTVYKDSGITTATASADSGATDTEITLSITPATGMELDRIEVITGGVTVNQETKKFKIGEADVVLMVRSKNANRYRVTEDCMICVNDVRVTLKKNVTVLVSRNGGIVDVTCDGTVIAMNDAVQSLIDQEILVKM